MEKSTRVKALLIAGRKFFVLRYKDPASGKMRDETTEIPAIERNRSRAAKLAAQREDELSGVRSHWTWEEFDEACKDEWLIQLSPGYAITWDTTTKCLADWAADVRRRMPDPCEIDPDLLHAWSAWMRRQGFAKATQRSYLGTLRAGLGFAADKRIIAFVPRFPRIKNADTMGGRPITTEEFERMLECVKHVRPRREEDWKRLLRGLWLSGLRISESLDLSWDWSAVFAVDLADSCFMIRQQKSQKPEYAPMTPDFSRFLAETPEGNRRGSVFGFAITPNEASRMVSRIGKRAGVVTTDNGSHATAHDLRRSFGSRWASRVHPAELQKLMRHADIATTMKYYVRLDSAELARKLREGEKTGEKPRRRVVKKRSRKSP